MNCLLRSSNSKAWGKAIQTLISTGDNDVHFKFSQQCLTITTFESSLSVCCICSFEKEFFEKYEVSLEDPITCRVPSKCLLKAFRSLRFLSKSVSWCEINFQENSDILNIVQKMKYGPAIRYKLRLCVESEALEMDCCPDRLCNWIKVDSKFFLGTIANFGPTNKIADLTLKTLDDTILLKNCNTDVVKREGKIYTELCVNLLDFAGHSITQESEVTVALRELKIFVAFAESQKLDFWIHFQSSTDPVIIVVQNEFYKASLNLATRVPTDGGSRSTNTTTQSEATSRRIGNVTSQSQQSPDVPSTSVRARKRIDRSTIPTIPSADLNSEEALLLAENNGSESENEFLRRQSFPRTPRRLTDFGNRDIPSPEVNSPENQAIEIPELSTANSTAENTGSSQPPEKRLKTFRSIFPGLFTDEKPFTHGLDVILCPDSDDSDDSDDDEEDV